MNVLFLLLALLAPDTAPPGGAIEATIRGTRQPLEVELLLRQEDESWQEVAHRSLPAATRQVRFEGLASGVYQLRIRGSETSEQFAMKVGLGQGDERRPTIAIESRKLTGRITLGGANLGAGTLVLRHKELRWEAEIPVREDGTFHAPVWQYGMFAYSVRTPALPTPYTSQIELDGTPAAIDIPNGRITGVVRNAKSGTAMAGVMIALQSNVGSSEKHVRTTTNAQGRFDFVGMKFGRHKVRVSSPEYVEPVPVVFELKESAPSREMDVRLEPGRAVPLLVVGADGHPVQRATVYALTGAKICARATTDEDGRTAVAVPEREEAALFVIAPEGGFGVARVAMDRNGERLRVDLPHPSSSLSMRARTKDGTAMPPFSLLMRYDGAIVPMEVLEELTAVQGLHFSTGTGSDVKLDGIPGGSYEFWPYRTEEEAEAIVAAGEGFAAPILVNVHEGKNTIAVKFAAR
jgi:5-hydroxyisourate hydrolase-like protein (transthyretin family)